MIWYRFLSPFLSPYAQPRLLPPRPFSLFGHNGRPANRRATLIFWRTLGVPIADQSQMLPKRCRCRCQLSPNRHIFGHFVFLSQCPSITEPSCQNVGRRAICCWSVIYLRLLNPVPMDTERNSRSVIFSTDPANPQQRMYLQRMFQRVPSRHGPCARYT